MKEYVKQQACWSTNKHIHIFNQIQPIKSHAFTHMVVNFISLWDTKCFSLMGGYRRFGGTNYLRHQDNDRLHI